MNYKILQEIFNKMLEEKDYKKLYDDLVESNKENAVIQSMNDMMITTNKIKEENVHLKTRNEFLTAMLSYNREVINHTDTMLNNIYIS